MGSRVQRAPSGSQVIISSYIFQCCGSITRWRSYVDPGGREDGKYDITFQVWRPSENVMSDGSGCYTLVDRNQFLNIDLGSGGLVDEAPSLSNQIQVQRGDIVGFHATHDDGDGGIQLDDTYTSESVWYTQSLDNSQCVSGMVSNNYAPILEVTIGKSK